MEIIVTTTNCSREEQAELAEYLEENCWSWKFKEPKKRRRKRF